MLRDVADGSRSGRPAQADAGRLAAPEQRPAGEILADQIVTAIALGEFVPGQRLPSERELADALGVSRATVRDAVGRAAAMDLVEVRRGRTGGAYIRSPWSATSAAAVRAFLEPRWTALEHVMDMRHLVEALVARTAAERRNRDDVRAIKAALRDYERASDLRDAQEADLRLHHAVARATHNERLLELREQLLAEVSLGFAVEPFTRAIYDRALPEHQALAAAVADKDEPAAWQLGKQHFTITADELRATLARAISDAGP
jgi:GntR family transcriptional repressor for pyruvate dehydrogenase complex